MTVVPKVVEVDSVEKDGITETHISLDVSADLLYFQGHFAESAMLPGVVQIAWAVEFAKRYLGLSANVREMKSVKFSRPILPQSLVKLTLLLSANRERLHFGYSVQKIECSAGILILS